VATGSGQGRSSVGKLVWVQRSVAPLLEDPAPGLEILPFPDDIASDPRAAEVELVVLGFGPTIGPGFEHLTSLRVIQTPSAGVDTVVDSLPRPDVVLCCSRGPYDVPVAEWVVGAVLAGQKAFPFYRDEQAAARWTRHEMRAIEGSTVLFLGHGSIARATEARLAPFGVEVLRVARRQREGVSGLEALPEFAGRADVVVVLLPLTEATRGLLGASFFSSMRNGALLVNAARGAIIDQDALLEALRSERIRAVIDVTYPEPLPGDHPLWHAPGVFITPHSSGVTANGQAKVFKFLREQLARFAADEPLENIVEAGY